MTLAALLVWLLILIAIAAIVWYVLKSVPLPEPLRIVIIVILAIVCILILLNVGGSLTGTGPLLRL